MRESPRFEVLFPSPERQRAGQLAMIFPVEFVKVGAVANLLRMPVNIARKAFRKNIFCQKRQESYVVGTYGRRLETVAGRKRTNGRLGWSCMHRILLIGATGRPGRQVLAQLPATGLEIPALAHTPAAAR